MQFDSLVEDLKMYGLIATLTIVPGKREEMIAILRESAADMPGSNTPQLKCRACNQRAELNWGLQRAEAPRSS